LATVTAWPQLAAMVEFWVARLPLPETMPPATVGNARRLDRVDTVSSPSLSEALKSTFSATLEHEQEWIYWEL